MSTTNPVFNQNSDFNRTSLETMFNTTPNTETLTIEHVITKTAISFGVLIIGAAVGWFIPALLWPGASVGLVLALVNIFRNTISPGLILAYAFAQGTAVGAISMYYSTMWDGIVTQAILGTLAVVGITLALFLNGKVRVSAKVTKIVLITMLGYFAFSIINLILMATGVTTSMFGLRTEITILGIPLGVVLGLVVILLAAYMLVMDFDTIQRGIENKLPSIFAWKAAFGLMVTIIWLYLEILRLLAIMRR